VAAADSEEAALDVAGRDNDTGAARALADGYVAALHDAIGSRLRGAVLFGSAARGEWIEGRSDVNVLVLLDSLDAPLLARAAEPSRAALVRGVTPLLMEPGEWRHAADVFALELADMQDAHVGLLGDDPVPAVELKPAYMRLQAERELRAKLLHLHAGMMMASDDSRRLGTLFMAALPSFSTYMRAVLRLHGEAVPHASRHVIAYACRAAGADPTPFLDVLAARESGAELVTSLDAGSLADGFNTAATALAAHIDNHGR
jgi:hypothetical protein